MRSSLVVASLFMGVLPAMAQEGIDLPAKRNLPEVSLAPVVSQQEQASVADGYLSQSALGQKPLVAPHGAASRPYPAAPGGAAKGGRPSSSAPVEQKKLSVADRKVDDDDFKMAPGTTLAPPSIVLPEVTTTIQLSASDLNRIVCPDGEIKEAITSDEKGLMIKITGKDAFLKFKVGKRSDGKLSYSTTPTEIYMVCGGSTYSMIAFPARMPSQTIKLSSGKESRIKENQSLYAGLPFERRVMRAIKEVYTDNIPDTYNVKKMNDIDQRWKGMVVTHIKDVVVEGEGMTVKEYRISLKPGRKDAYKLTEKMFLRKEFADNPIAVSIDKHTLRSGDVSRLFIVEQKQDTALGGQGLMLPEVDSGGSSGGPSSIAPAQQPKPTIPMGGSSRSKAGGGLPVSGLAGGGVQ